MGSSKRKFHALCGFQPDIVPRISGWGMLSCRPLAGLYHNNNIVTLNVVRDAFWISFSFARNYSYNPRHKSWNTGVIFPLPNVDLGLQSFQCSKIRLAQHWGRKGAHLSENKGVKSECKKFGEYSRQMAPVSSIFDEYCSFIVQRGFQNPWNPSLSTPLGNLSPPSTWLNWNFVGYRAN